MATLKTGLGPIITFLNTICDHPDLFEPYFFLGSAEDHLSTTYVVAVGNSQYVDENYSGLGGILFDESPNKHRRRSRPRDLVLYKLHVRVFSEYIDTLEQGDKELVDIKALAIGALDFAHKVNFRELRQSTKLGDFHFPWPNLKDLGEDQESGVLASLNSFCPPITEYFKDWANLFDYYVKIPCDYNALCNARGTALGAYSTEGNHPYAFISEASSFSYMGDVLDPYEGDDSPKYAWVLTNSWQMYYQEICSLESHTYTLENGEEVREIKNFFPVSKHSRFDLRGAKIDCVWLKKIKGKAFTDIDVLCDEVGNVSLRGMLAKRYTFFVSNRSRYISQNPSPSAVRRVVYQNHPSFDPEYLHKDVVSVPGLTMARVSGDIFKGIWKKPATWFKAKEGNLYGLLVTIDLEVTLPDTGKGINRRRRGSADSHDTILYTYTYTVSAFKLSECSRSYNKKNGYCGPVLNESSMLAVGEEPSHISEDLYTGSYVTDEAPCSEFILGCINDGTVLDTGHLYKTVYFQGRCIKLLLEAIKGKEVSLWLTLQGHHRIAWPDRLGDSKEVNSNSMAGKTDYPKIAPMVVTDDTCDISMGGLSYFFMPTRHIFYREFIDRGDFTECVVSCVQR